jgi:hypothetical protein
VNISASFHNYDDTVAYLLPENENTWTYLEEYEIRKLGCETSQYVEWELTITTADFLESNTVIVKNTTIKDMAGNDTGCVFYDPTTCNMHVRGMV